MVKTMKNGARRSFAVVLSVLMLLSAWVFFAPETLLQASATAGDYPWTVQLTRDDDADGWNYAYIQIWYKTNNGEGNESGSWESGDFQNTINDGDYTASGTGTGGKFPYKVRCWISIGGGATWREFSGTLKLWICGQQKVTQTIHAKSSAFSKGTDDQTCYTSLPVLSYNTIGGGSTSIDVPKNASGTGSTAYTNAFTYDIGTPTDDYGVGWYKDLSVGLDANRTGVSYDATNKKIGVNCNANRKDNYTVRLNQYLGSDVVSYKDVTVKTWDYSVKFYDEDHTTVRKTESVDYNDSATPPTLSKAPDEEYHYANATWSGDSYSNLTTGAQEKKVYASYAATAHTAQSDYSQSDEEHWKQCTTCGYIIGLQNTHQPKSDWGKDSNNHWKLCATCGRQLKITDSGALDSVDGHLSWPHTEKTTYDSDGNQHWKQCSKCGWVTTPAANHVWDYAHATFNWDDFECEDATVSCVCGRTKTVSTTVTCVNTPATCEAAGSNVYTAKFTIGSTNYTATKTEELEALGHDYSGAYQALSGNEHNRACVNGCGTYGIGDEKNATEACVGEMSFRSDAEGHWKKCQFCSNVTTAKTSHTPKSTYETDDNQHWVICSSCGYVTTPQAGHQWQWTVDTAQGCTTPGVGHYYCTVCLKTKDLNTPINPDGHNWGNPVYTWSADKTTVTATRTCFTNSAHKETETVSVSYYDDAATCTATGTRHYTSAAFENEAFEVQTGTDTLAKDLDNHLFTAHDDSDEYLASAATCEDNTMYYLRCDRCAKCTNDAKVNDTGTYGGATWEKANTALGHLFNGDAVTVSEGKHYYKCARYNDCGACGYNGTKNATQDCYGGTADCANRAVCEACGMGYGDLDPDKHDFNERLAASKYIKTPATCTDNAVYYYKCTRCTKNSNDEKVNGTGTYGGRSWTAGGSALGHKYNGAYHAMEGLTHNRACTQVWEVDGVEMGCGTYGLIIDGAQYTNEYDLCTPGSMQSDATDHWVQCRYCSNYTTPKAAHDPVATTAYAHDNNNHWKLCSVCNYYIVPSAGHNWVEIIDTPANCTTNGSKHEECSICHRTRNNTVIPKLNHAWSDVTYTWAPDNSTVTASRTCSNANCPVGTESETVEVSTRTTAATCVATGLITYSTSKPFSNSAFLAQVKTETIEIDPTNHNRKIRSVALVKASCTEDGERAHYFCSACEKKFSDAAGTVLATNLVIPAREHNIDAGIVTLAATCTATGVMKYTCQNTVATEEYKACSYTYNEDIEIDPANHDGHLAYQSIVKASCTADGVRAHYYCSACEKKFSNEAGTTAVTDEALKIEKRSHVLNDGEITTTPTCAETGIKTYTCTNVATEEYEACSYTEEEVLAKDPDNHTGVIDPENQSELRNYVQESCSEPGYSGDLYCLGCGQELAHGAVIPTQPHTYTGEYTDVPGAKKSDANCVSPAIYIKSCKYCRTLEDADENNTFTYGEIDPTNHPGTLTYTEHKDTSCLEPGNEAYYTCPSCHFNFSDNAGHNKMDDVVIAQLAHSYTGEAVDQGDGTHKVRCVNGCNQLGSAIEHVWVEGATVAPTCTVDGSKDYTCSAAGKGCSATKHDVLAHLGHDWQASAYHWAADFSYCVGTKTCANDIKGDGVKDHVITETVTHIVRTVPEQPTCKKPGRYVYTATFTNSVFTEQYTSEVIPAGQHVLVKINAIPPTCSEDGSKTYWVCTACGHYFGDAEGTTEIALASTFISRTGHNYIGEARDNKDGTHSYACFYDCGTYGNKTEHVFNRTVATEKYLATYSDCVTPSTYYYSCECGAKGTATFEGTPLGHNFVEIEGRPATCTEVGYNTHKACTRCGETEGKSEIAKLGHGQFLYDHDKSGRVYDGTFEWASYSCSRGCGESYTLFTIHAKDTSGKPVVGAEVTITDKNDASRFDSGITGNDGTFLSDAHFSDGEYTIDITYTSGGSVMNATGGVRVAGSRGSGGIGALAVVTPSTTTPTSSSDPTPTEPAPTNPSGNNGGSSSGGCRYCGETHDGPFGWFIQLIHNILAAFSGK